MHRIIEYIGNSITECLDAFRNVFCNYFGGTKVKDGDELVDELSKFKEELHRTREQLKCAIAESNNFRRRQEVNFEKRLNIAKDELICRFLPFIDNLELATKACQESGDDEALRSGVELIHKNVIKTLADLDIHPIISIGETFDPAWHEAIAIEERDDLEDNTVVDEFTRGYKCGERVIRPSVVKVTRNFKQY